ncbi:hypothetical protein [Caulobacter phage Kronos]|uniref:Lipoprotein n=1 Tax=Caulobacter phage Kronos TaxID=2340873 RepID=A0A386KQH1_9CAUD|nr:hypothetical protein [Caulobacter phage Kronos]
MTPARAFAAGFVAAYLVASCYCGWAMCRTMPALNWRGGVVIGLTWPMWVQGWPFGRFMPPPWCFTFK